MGGGSSEAAGFRPPPHLPPPDRTHRHPTFRSPIPTVLPMQGPWKCIMSIYVKIRRKNILIMNLAWIILIFVPKQWLNIIDIQKTTYLMCTTW